MIGPEFQAGLQAFAAFLSAVVSIKELVKSENMPLMEASRLVLKRNKGKIPEDIDAKTLHNIISEMTVINDSLLEQLEKDAIACADKHVADIACAKTNSELADAHLQATMKMCQILATIKQFNGGVFPPTKDVFMKFWLSYRCPE